MLPPQGLLNVFTPEVKFDWCSHNRHDNTHELHHSKIGPRQVLGRNYITNRFLTQFFFEKLVVLYSHNVCDTFWTLAVRHQWLWFGVSHGNTLYWLAHLMAQLWSVYCQTLRSTLWWFVLPNSWANSVLHGLNLYYGMTHKLKLCNVWPNSVMWPNSVPDSQTHGQTL